MFPLDMLLCFHPCVFIPVFSENLTQLTSIQVTEFICSVRESAATVSRWLRPQGHEVVQCAGHAALFSSQTRSTAQLIYRSHGFSLQGPEMP